VTLEFPGRQGQVTRRKSGVPNHRLSVVFSEGEQKVIALADFLAELGFKPPAPVVFDDPITSLDYQRMHDLVLRIVALSEQRQVIVFTHNIWFTTQLLSQFEERRADCSYFGVGKVGNDYGLITLLTDIQFI
jgi:wobble nucleotide-excising tRNase